METTPISETNWQEVLLEVTKALEAPQQLSDTKNLEKLLNYQRELNFYHLKVEFLAKTADSLGSVVRRVQQ